MRAIAIKAADSWSGQPADRVVLDYDDRHRRRIAMTGNKGTAFLLDLPSPAELRGGDALLLEDGRLVEVVAAPELLLEIRCADARHLARVAWHIGNRHVPAQVLSNALRIRRDHVLADLAQAARRRRGGDRGAVHSGGRCLSTRACACLRACLKRARSSARPRESADRSPALRSRVNEGAATDRLEAAALYRLMTWLSPAYPVGAFSYSSGIEWAVEAGDIGDAETLRRWIEVMLSAGAGMSDGIFFSHAHRAVTGGDDAALVEVAELAAAFVPTRERFLETTAMGRAFLEVTQAAWPCAAFAKLQQLWTGPVAYPIAVATACAGHGVPLGPALHAFLTAVSSNWVSAGIRLIPLGHTDGQRIMKALEPTVTATAQRALTARLDELGSAVFRADIASARHETQYTRLFRS